MAEPALAVRNEHINCRIDGPADAPAVVLSNSLGTNLTMWDAQMPALTERFRVVRYDARGQGASTSSVGVYGVETLGRDVLRLLDALRIRHAHFCGISMGGAIGLWLALNAPERVDRLVLANTSAKFGTPERWNARIDAVTRGGMAAVADGVIETWFTPGFRARAAGEVARLKAVLLAAPVDGYLAACRAVRDIDLTAHIGTIARPTLVIVGARDVPTPPEQGRAVAARIPGARVVELPAAHISNVEAASQFNAEVIGFLMADKP